MQPLTLEQRNLIGFIESEWHSRGKFPMPDLISAKFDIDIKELLEDNETVRKALINRGIKIPNYNLVNTELEGLTNEQISAIITILNLDDRRPRATKLKEMGLTVTQWNGWMKDPKFVDYLHTISTKNFGAALDRAHEGLLKTVERGDVNGIKLYMELTGRTQAGNTNTQNIKVILQRVVEVIQMHVKDPTLLRAIALDFEKLMNGEEVNPRKQIEV